MNLLISFIFALIVSLITTKVVRTLALRWKIGASPDERRIHKGFIPLLGGIGIYAGFICGIVVYLLLNPDDLSVLIDRYGGIIIASTLILIAGVYDDVKGISAQQKFLFQFFAVTVILYFGCFIKQIDLPFGTTVELGIFSIPVTYLWLIGVSNAINLLDGLDGLAGGVGVIIAAVFLFLGWQNGDVMTMVLAIALIAGLLGFLRYNYHPATIFMGDTGSLFIGLFLAGLSIRGLETAPGTISILAPLIALAIPIGDTSVAFFRRLNRGRHPFKPDKDHLHHRLIFLGLSHKQAVNILLFAAFIYAVTAILVETQTSFLALILLFLVVILSFLGLKRIGYLEAQRSQKIHGDHSVITKEKTIAPLSMERLTHKLILGFTDIIMLNLALFIGWIIRFRTDMLPSNIQLDLSDLLFSPASIILTFCWIVLFFANDLYRMRWDISRFDHVRRVSKVITFGILILFLITLDPENLFSEGRLTTLLYGFLLLITVNSGRLIVIGVEKYFSALEYAPHNTLLIGTTDKARKLLKDINKNPHLLYNIVGYVSREPTDKIFYGYKCLGRYSEIPEIIRSFNIEEVIIAINERSRDEILNIVSMAEGIKVNFKILPQIYDVVSGHKTEEVIGHPLIRLFPDRMRLWQWITKRLIDIFLSFFLLVLFSPIFLLVFFLLWVSGIHPPLVYTNIFGKNKQVFGMLNFETNIKNNAKQPIIGRLLEITRFYKFPSLVNILLGKMSFVGPRPETETDVEQVSKKIKFYNRRFEVKPGLTGWAQVKYRYEEALKHKRDQFKQDLFYLENMSITFDIRIILRSILIFLLRR